MIDVSDLISGNTDIYTFVFEDVLGVETTGDPVGDIIFKGLLPLLLIYAFVGTVAGEMGMFGSQKTKGILSAIIWFTIIYYGHYPFFASIAWPLFALYIIFRGLAYVFKRVVPHPSFGTAAKLKPIADAVLKARTGKDTNEIVKGWGTRAIQDATELDKDIMYELSKALREAVVLGEKEGEKENIRKNQLNTEGAEAFLNAANQDRLRAEDAFGKCMIEVSKLVTQKTGNKDTVRSVEKALNSAADTIRNDAKKGMIDGKVGVSQTEIDTNVETIMKLVK